MKPGLFRSSTALVMMVSLAAPMPVVAQDTGAIIGLQQMGAAEIAAQIARCQDLARAQGIVGAEGSTVLEGSGPEIELCNAYLSGQLDTLLSPELASTAFFDELAAEGAAGAEAGAEAETEAEVAEGSGDAQAEQPAETAEAPTEGQDDAAEAEAEQVRDGTADAQDEQPAETAEAPGEGQDDAAEAEAEQAQDGSADAQAEQPAETAEGQGSETQAEADGNAEATAEAEAATAQEDTRAQTQGEAAARADATAATDDAAEAAEPASEVQPMDSQEQADALAAAETEEPAAAAAEAGAAGTAEVEVVEETVTEETARSSDEEFATGVTENVTENPAQPQAEPQTDPQAAPAAEEDDGLSNAQRAALLGLGALAVGSLLKSGEKVVTNSGDRAVVEQDGRYRVLKNDDALLRQPGSDVTTYRFQDGSTRTVVVRGDGTEVETIRAADGRVLRRTRTLPDGSTTVLFDDTQKAEQVEVSQLPRPRERRAVDIRRVEAQDLAAALAAAQADGVNRSFSLAQIRQIDAVRRLVPEITVDSINFETGSAVIRPEEAEELAALGNALRDMIDRNPAEVFLVEGHTDAVGSAAFNLALSDRRAESVALALTEYFDVPPENLVVQGYGESDLAVQTQDAERANRRAAVRRITPLLQSARN